jgi:hypothetical protein
MPRAAAMPPIAIGVSIRPGVIALQRTPRDAPLIATLSVIRFIAALDTS